MSPYDTGGAYGKRGLVFYDDVYNNFYSTHSSLVVGVDTSATDNIQLGIFGNYGNINLTQFATRHRWWFLESQRLRRRCHGQLLG